MTVEERTGCLARLGGLIGGYLSRTGPPVTDSHRALDRAVERAGQENPWFTKPNISYALSEIARVLRKDNLERWLSAYPRRDLDPVDPARVGVVMAGNIPLAGFHDFLSVLISGHGFAGKLSSRDRLLPRTLSEQLTGINRKFSRYIELTEDRLSGCDAYIATGSDNTYRYFDYYFGHKPHIFRKNRNGIAVLSGNESPRQLSGLADDVFLYFGLGCRNVSKVYVPPGHDFGDLFRAMEKYRHLVDHHKYANNYDYRKSIYLLNNIPHLDNGFILFREDPAQSSPIATLHYEYYRSTGELLEKIRRQAETTQCVLSASGLPLNTLQPGRSQKPELWEYADDMDTMEFLINLCKN